MTDVTRFGVVPLSEMPTDDVPEKRTLPELAAEARAFLQGHRWCPPIVEQYYSVGVAGVLGVFLFELAPSEKVDPILWVIVGDLPSVYLVIDEAPDGLAALECYCTLMEAWARAVLAGEPLDEYFPVRAAPTEEHARMLLSRVGLIRDEIIPAFREDLVE